MDVPLTARHLLTGSRRRPASPCLHDADVATDHAVAEELEGLVVRQQQQNRPDQAEPLLRVIVANKVLTVYHPPLRQGDSYLDTLVDELSKVLGRDGPSPVEWSVSTNPSMIRCGQDQMALFAGRDDAFADFLGKTAQACHRDNLPEIVGDDAASRFIAQPDERDRDQLNLLRVSYVSMGSVVALAGESCGPVRRRIAGQGSG